MIKFINILIHKLRQMKARRWLKRQRLLAFKGIGLRTKVLAVKEEGHPIKDYVQLCIFTRLRVNGKIIYRRVHTVLKKEVILHAGDKVHIRYDPYHLNAVLLNGLSDN